ncbi:MAG: Gingipain R [Candidatus Cloacimonetes bacterium HGW-Cloacimonetes-1]|jgi:hypothetical protein|nr:MAG: Gingipain R [Candidatus Cloacimonetes bacterium HGW-Cloacimonetes-1]
MKKQVLFVVLLTLVSLMMASVGNIKLQNSPTGVTLLRSSDQGIAVKYSIDALDYKDVNTSKGVFTDVYVKDYTTTNITGEPKLPLMRQIIQVPLGASVISHVMSSDVMTVDLKANGINYPVLPRQESVSKSEDPSKLPFVIKQDFYNGKSWTDYPIVKVEELGMMRGVRLVAIDFMPVKYNADLGQMEVIKNAEIQFDFVGSDLAATQELLAKTYSPAFEMIYAKTVLNYNPSRVTLNRYPLGYVIVTPQSFVSTLQPFIDWKRREGFNVTVATTETIGTSTTAIKNYLQGLWNAATTENPAPSYLLIVGDTPQVPAFTGATDSGHVTDLNYVRLQGTDYVPEMYYGRFSATNVSELQPQIDKSMMHEQYTMPSDAYLADVVMIAGVDSNFGPTHANGQINYGVNNYFNASNGITSYTYMYPASGSSDAAIVSRVSQGVGYVNYTAHGNETSWADPTFTISNINSLQNANEYPVVVGNCCLTNHFDTGLCFGEAWLRAANKGAVLYIGGTNSSYWDEDYYWGVGYKPPVVASGSPFVPNRVGVYDAIFHNHNEAFADWAGTAGSMIFMGNLAVTASNSSRINYYWEIYSIMGDPSLIPYVGIPAQLTTNYPETIFLGVSSIELTTDPYTLVAVSSNNVLHGVGVADAGGQLVLNFTPFENPGAAQLVMTRSNRRPMIVNLPILPNVGPYVTATTVVVNDGNNGTAEAGETIGLDVSFNNVGVQDATNLTATISTDSPYMVFTQSTASINVVASNQTVTVSNAFTANVSAMIPDQTVVPITITIVDGNNSWVSNRSITVNAADVSFANISFADGNGNGYFEAGETVNITVNLTNTGHMDAASGTMMIVSNNSAAILSQGTFTLPSINMNGSVPVTFSVDLGNTLTNGTVVVLGVAVDAGSQMVNNTILLPIGVISEGFESNNFTTFPWQNTSSLPWTLVTGTDNYHSGAYGAKTGTITHNGSTSLQVTMNIGADGDISFWRRVSSEVNYDFLKFYIDGVEKASWSGTQAWTQFSYPVTVGQRTFKWTYSKDGSLSSGSDAAWIDDIVFPMTGVGTAAMFYTPNETINITNAHVNTTVSADLIIRNLGNTNLTGMINLPAGFTLSYGSEQLPQTYNYQVPANETKVFSVSYAIGSEQINITDVISITSNDANTPVYVVTITVSTSTANDDGLTPVITALNGNYPNPFNPETAIRFAVKDSGPVRLSVFNIKGQLVKTLVNNSMSAGNHSVVWNGKDNSGASVSSGVYLYRMEAKGFTQTRKMMLMK